MQASDPAIGGPRTDLSKLDVAKPERSAYGKTRSTGWVKLTRGRRRKTAGAVRVCMASANTAAAALGTFLALGF
jgi:hypothetical protein